mgnify:CR=1 FL=1
MTTLSRLELELQGGDPSFVESPDGLPSARIVDVLAADKSGFVSSVDAENVGRAAFLLGSGRERRDDEVDFVVGVSDLRQVGESVERGEPLARIHANATERLEEARALLTSAFLIVAEPPAPSPLVLEAITAENLSS